MSVDDIHRVMTLGRQNYLEQTTTGMHYGDDLIVGGDATFFGNLSMPNLPRHSAPSNFAYLLIDLDTGEIFFDLS